MITDDYLIIIDDYQWLFMITDDYLIIIDDYL